MKEFYLVKKLNRIISVNNKSEIITRMRAIEWNNKSNNSDYMHVYAFWKNQNSHLQIRFENETDFIEDLIKFQQIKKISNWDYLTCILFGRDYIKEKNRVIFS